VKTDKEEYTLLPLLEGIFVKLPFIESRPLLPDTRTPSRPAAPAIPNVTTAAWATPTTTAYKWSSTMTARSILM
jgi:hypothetical protein